MATLVQTATPAADDANDASLSISFPSPTTVGNLVLIWCCWEGNAGTVTFTDGTNDLVSGTLRTHANTDLNGQFFWQLQSAGATTFSWKAGSPSRPFKKVMGYEFSYSGTCTLDAEVTATGTSDNTTISSGNLTAHADVEVALSGYAAYDSLSVVSSEQINGSAATGTTNQGASELWYRLPTDAFTGAATALLPNLGAGQAWVVSAITFKVAAGGGETITADKWLGRQETPPRARAAVVPSGTIGIKAAA